MPTILRTASLTCLSVHHLFTGVADVGALFSQRNVPESLKDKYISLLEKFEVALTIKRRHVIIPSLMPDSAQYPKTTDVLRDSRLESSLSNIEAYYQPPLRRFWLSNYIPDGFWPRLICRIANDQQIGKVRLRGWGGGRRGGEGYDLLHLYIGVTS